MPCAPAFQVSTALDLARMAERFRRRWRRRSPRSFAADGIDPALTSYGARGDLRYVGQGYELRVAVDDGAVDAATIDAALARFHAAHRAEYGHAFPDSPVEIVNLRVTGIGAAAEARRGPRRGRAAASPPRRCARRRPCSRSTARRSAWRHRFSRATDCRSASTDRRPGDRPADRHHHRRAARLHARRRCRRQPHHHALRSAAMDTHVPVPIDPITASVDPGRAREHRRRDGLQADADVLLLDHPRVGGFRRGAGRRRGAAAGASARSRTPLQSGPDPGYVKHMLRDAEGARRRGAARRRDHAQRPLWRRARTGRTSPSSCRSSTGRAGRLLGDDGAPPRHRRAARRAPAASSTRSMPMPKGLQFQRDQGRRRRRAQRGGVADPARQHPRLRPRGRRHGGAGRGQPHRRRAHGRPGRARTACRPFRAACADADGPLRAADAPGDREAPRRHLRGRDLHRRLSRRPRSRRAATCRSSRP